MAPSPARCSAWTLARINVLYFRFSSACHLDMSAVAAAAIANRWSFPGPRPLPPEPSRRGRFVFAPRRFFFFPVPPISVQPIGPSASSHRDIAGRHIVQRRGRHSRLDATGRSRLIKLIGRTETITPVDLTPGDKRIAPAQPLPGQQYTGGPSTQPATRPTYHQRLSAAAHVTPAHCYCEPRHASRLWQCGGEQPAQRTAPSAAVHRRTAVAAPRCRQRTASGNSRLPADTGHLQAPGPIPRDERNSNSGSYVSYGSIYIIPVPIRPIV